MLDVELVRCARKTYSTVDEQYIGIMRDGAMCVDRYGTYKDRKGDLSVDSSFR